MFNLIFGKSGKEGITMQITDIKIRKLFDDGPMKAVVSITIENAIAVHDVKVIYARDKYFIVMPSRKNPDGTYRDIVHPINAQFRAELERVVLAEYEREVERQKIEQAAEAAQPAPEFADAGSEDTPF